MEFGEIVLNTLVWLWSVIVATIKCVLEIIDAAINWLWCTKELVRLGIQEGLNVPAKFMLDDMARIPVLRRVVTMSLALESSICMALAIAFLAMALVIWLVSRERKKLRKRSGIQALLAALAVIALMLVDAVMWGTLLVRW